MSEPTLVDMLKAGVHFGHQQSRRHPKMEPYIFTTRGGVSIINLEKTKAALSQATAFVHDLVARGGTVLFIGTKRQAREIIQAAAQTGGIPYVTDRWIGGLFTNFANVRQLSQKLHRLKEERASGSRSKYTKKEQFVFDAEIERLEQLVGGVANMERLPEAIFVTDVKQEKTAVHEAKKIGIPIIAVCDTNVNPVGINYCIPANDDATKSLQMITQAMAEAVQKGHQDADANLAAAARQAAKDLAAVNAATDEVVPVVDVAAVPEVK